MVRSFFFFICRCRFQKDASIILKFVAVWLELIFSHSAKRKKLFGRLWFDGDDLMHITCSILLTAHSPCSLGPVYALIIFKWTTPPVRSEGLFHPNIVFFGNIAFAEMKITNSKSKYCPKRLTLEKKTEEHNKIKLDFAV